MRPAPFDSKPKADAFSLSLRARPFESKPKADAFSLSLRARPFESRPKADAFSLSLRARPFESKPKVDVFSLSLRVLAKAGYDRTVADPKVRDRIDPDSQTIERVEHPRLWKVLLHNDDYTTQEFVVWVLESIFHLPHAEAFAVMMHVHQRGIGVAGLFTRDVAETRVRATQQLAEQHEYPLLVTIEPEQPESGT